MPKLTYFAGRGLAEIPRLLLAQAGVAYEDVRLEDISAIKASLPYGQVPLYEEDGLRLVQSNTISRYIARTHNLYGKDAKEAAQIDLWIDGLNDLRSAVSAAKTDEAKAALPKEVIPKWFKNFEELAKSHKGGQSWLVGDSISWADIALYNLLFNYATTYPGSVDAFPTLQAVQKRVAAEPKIAAWVAKRPQTAW